MANQCQTLNKVNIMKMTVIRVEATNVSGISKSGTPYHIDNTMVTVQVPIDSKSNPDTFGYQEMSYQYGESTNYNKLAQFKDQLPLSMDIDLGAGFNQYGKVITVITDVKLPQVVKS
ncbi:MAG: hypothetical protein [Inoviridae sp.]|nr:MAG: hypothetical protein [Inoviridae sp.]